MKTSVDKSRVTHINHLMNGLHSSCNNIYEHLMDQDFEELNNEIKELIKKLKEIQESTRS